MAWTAWGGWRTGLAALTLASLGLAVSPAGAASPASGTLYAVSNNGSELVSVDPVTGAQTPTANVGTLAPGMGLATPFADPTSTLVYADGSIVYGGGRAVLVTDQIATIDAMTGTVHLSPVLKGNLSPEMSLDPATKQLWAVASCFGCFQSILSIDPATGAETTLATFPFLSAYPLTSLARDAAANVLYVAGGSSAPLNLVAFNTVTHALSTSTMLAQPLSDLAFDSSSGTLLGLTAAQPVQLVSVNPGTGAETPIATFPSTLSSSGFAVDSATHTAYIAVIDSSSVYQVATVNDQTGAMSIGGATANVTSLAFRGAPVVPVTNATLRQDLERAHASGAIPSARIEASLMAKLRAASAATSRGQCRIADRDYQAFINQLMALSGKQVAAPTASSLAAESQSLIVACR